MRYENNLDTDDVFLGLLVITDATAKGIFTAIKNFMIENGISYKDNMIGFEKTRCLNQIILLLRG